MRAEALLALAALTLVTACGDRTGPAGVAPGTQSPSQSPSAAAAETGVPLPLTGAPGKDPQAFSRPVLAAVLRFTPGRPVIGADAADIVYHEPGKGAEHRLIALFHSRDPAKLGPFGNTQPSDALLLRLLKPVYAHAGGAERLTSRLTGANLVQVSPAQSGAAFSNVGGSLYAAPATLRKVAGPRAGRPLQLLSYGEPEQPLVERPAATVTSVTVSVPGKPSQIWIYDANGWVQTGAGAPRVRVANLLIPQAVYRDLRADKAGTLVAEPSMYGTGQLTAVSGDQLAKGVWRRPTDKSPFTYTDSAGVPLRLAPGRTWILLAPAGTTVAGTSAR
jgi:hypothetical protein